MNEFCTNAGWFGLFAIGILVFLLGYLCNYKPRALFLLEEIETKYKEEHMKHEKTFEAINKLKDIEIELHRLKNALEMANRALDAQRKPLTREQIVKCQEEASDEWCGVEELFVLYARAIEAAHNIKE